jgi:hypothetical protein
MSIDLKKQTPSGLKNLLANSQRLGNAEMALAVVQEMHERGMATRHAALSWNQDRVDEAMEPFMRAAAGVPNNQRVNYTPAGGRKRGSTKDHPEHLWIDSYSAIKVPGANAVFGCAIKRPGEEPTFTLYLSDGFTRSEAKPAKVYNADQLQQALVEWKAIARDACDLVSK